MREKDTRNRKWWTAFDFWAKVDIQSSDECWPWLGGSYTDKSGYGRAYDGRTGTQRSAHVVAYELSTGKSIKWPFVGMHTCDNPPCCNPAHIKRGTQRTNYRDRVKKGRLGKVGCPRGTIFRYKDGTKTHGWVK